MAQALDELAAGQVSVRQEHLSRPRIPGCMMDEARSSASPPIPIFVPAIGAEPGYEEAVV